LLASKGLKVVLVDRSEEALSQAQRLAHSLGVEVELRYLDLENRQPPPLEIDYFGCILVFRYLHRPLMPLLREALRSGGILMYETYTVDQPRFGRPVNPDFLLKHGELFDCFKDWEILHSFEGMLDNPPRAVAQIISRKP
jgi:SAM-dependent methyltransferase